MYILHLALKRKKRKKEAKYNTLKQGPLVFQVDHFLSRSRYDDATRRRIVQHLCRRQRSLVPALATPTATPTLTRGRRVPAEAAAAAAAESTSGDDGMLSYSSADSTTDGATEPPCQEAGTTATLLVNDGNQATSCEPEVVGETSNMAAVCSEGEICHSVESTVAAVIDVHKTAAGADDNSNGSVHDVLSPVWRPW